ncbi:sensor histidine kinase [Candidatus Gracilibacteria bacterium]|nr:sensor histidine kinase [Candidatus Gracilibacteria bacterium]
MATVSHLSAVPATFNSVKFSQLLNNLISNACKYSNSGGVVRIRLSANEITIRDTGIGMTKTELCKITRCRYRARRIIRSGLGYGLIISKKICDELGFGLTLESCIGKGTRVTVVFEDLDDRSVR